MKTKNKAIILLFAAVFLLLFLNFDNIYLWSDEASTSILGKNILKYGYPSAFDGKNWVKSPVSQTIGITAENENYLKGNVWVLHSWLPYYVSASSMAVFGLNTFGARFLSVVFAFASLFLIWNLFNALYPDKKDKKISYLAMLILISSVFFFTFCRQARYYPLILFFTTGLLINYINLLKKERAKDSLLFSIFGIFLFHSHFVSFFITFVALFIHFFFFSNLRKKFKKFILPCLIITAFTLPWLIYAQPWNIGSDSSIFTLFNLYAGFVFFIRSVNPHYPILLLLLIPFLFKNKSDKKYLFSDGLLTIFIIVPIIIAAIFPVKEFRYIFGLCPLVFLLFSRLFYCFIERNKKNKANKIIVILVLVLLMTSTILSFIPIFILNKAIVSPVESLCIKYAPAEKTDRCERFIGANFRIPQIKFPIFYYIYEITHDYDGPNEGESKYLNEHGTENDLVYAYYGFLPLQFYTNMKVLDPSLYNLSNVTEQPDWIVPRWKGDYLTNELEQYAINNGYKRIEIPYPDIYWENRPEMTGHRFWTADDVANAVIYQKQ